MSDYLVPRVPSKSIGRGGGDSEEDKSETEEKPKIGGGDKDDYSDSDSSSSSDDRNSDGNISDGGRTDVTRRVPTKTRRKSAPAKIKVTKSKSKSPPRRRRTRSRSRSRALSESSDQSAADHVDRRREEEELAPRRELAEDEARLPDDLKASQRLRACMICSLIKSEMDFNNEGCDNCDRILHLAGQRGTAVSYTSGNFDGMIALMAPNDSWVSKWQHLRGRKKGLYAISVSGELPRFILRELAEMGVRHRSRDKIRLAAMANAGPPKSDNRRDSVPALKLRLSRHKSAPAPAKKKPNVAAPVTQKRSSGVVQAPAPVNNNNEDQNGREAASAPSVVAGTSVSSDARVFSEWRAVRPINNNSDDESEAPAPILAGESRRKKDNKPRKEFDDDSELEDI